jgi:hypothetical protein
VVQPLVVAALARWGLIDRLAATGRCFRWQGHHDDPMVSQ